MPKKKTVKSPAQEREDRARREGKLYRTCYERNAPAYRVTLAEAEEAREEILRRFHSPITVEGFTGHDPLVFHKVWIEHYERGSWHLIEGSEREVQRGSGETQEP